MSLDANKRALDLIGRLNLEEKFKLLSNHSGLGGFSTTPIDHLGIPSFEMTDGPMGVAWHSSDKKCTRFPATIGLAATWDVNLAYQMGEAIGEEVKDAGKHLLLAPGINIHRTPLNGRTFEYMSEDPFLAKEIAIAYVKGVQNQGVGACVKHYAANNQESNRRTVSSEIDERTLHEIYLRPFMETVQQAQPWSVMGSYNKINGKYVYENPELLQKLLIDKWGFQGFVVTDWDATKYLHSPEDCINSGLSLEMPKPHCYKLELLKKAYADGKIVESALDDVVRRFLRIMVLAGIFDNSSSVARKAQNATDHRALSRKVAEEGMVLLKNEGGLLPLDANSISSLALSGPNRDMRFGRPHYGGSSAVVPPYEITACEGILEKCDGKIKITSEADEAEVAIIFAGLNHDRGMDSEAADRKCFNLPQEQIELICATASKNPNTVVVLISGSPVGMEEWIDKVPVVLEAWYPGMESGRAIANLLFGQVNPSGKLPLTFPKNLNDSPAHRSGKNRTFPGDGDLCVHYDEGIFVGYRYFDNERITPMFPFGFGLSYTAFEIENMDISSQCIASIDDKLQVSVEVTNCGVRFGAEVVQVYHSSINPSIPRPPRELAGFAKVHLRPGEKKTCTIDVRGKDLAFYDVSRQKWMLDIGEIELQIGESSRTIILREAVVVSENQASDWNL